MQIPEPKGAIIAPGQTAKRKANTRSEKMMDWNALRYLLAVHRHGSLARAAKELKVTKATASRRLAALERSLGVPLVQRKPAGLVLTEAGRDAIAAAER